MMKTLFFLIIFAALVPAFGQDDLIKLKPTPTPEPNPLSSLAKLKLDDTEAKFEAWRETKRWKPVAESTQGPGYTIWFYQKARTLRGGDVEAWLKVVPVKPTPEQKAAYPRNMSYALQFFTFHCTDERFSIEHIAHYDRSGRVLRISSGLLGSIYRQPVTPGTVSEEIFEFFCGS